MKQNLNQAFFRAFSLVLLLGLAPGSALMAQETDAPQPAAKAPVKAPMATDDEHPASKGALDVKLKSIAGEEVDLSIYKGQVVVVVNTASKCGFTRQYKQLEEIHQAHHEAGLVVLGFPCNQFGGQEPGSEEDILKFCKNRFAVSFALFAKSDVNGKDRNALYKTLCEIDLKPTGKGDVKWNFEKFIIGRDGQPVGRYSSRVSPTDEEFVSRLKKELAKKSPETSTDGSAAKAK